MKQNMTVIITNELEMLGFIKANGTACRFVSIVTKTPVVKIKAGNPWGAGNKTKSGLYKVSRKIGIINAKYNDSVRRRIAEKLGVNLSEVEYEAGEVWYEHLKTKDGKNLPIVYHRDEARRNGDYYLQYFPHKSTSVYVDGSGEIQPDSIVKPWLYKESPRPEFKPSVLSINLRNILQLKASGIIMEMPRFEEMEHLLEQD